MRPPFEVVGAIGALLDRNLGEQVEAAFVYGSVAADAATAGSDVDTFVITRGDLPPERTSALAQRNAQLQIDLGYLPDSEHPIEIFSVRACVDALHEGLTLRALWTAARGEPLDRITFNSDCLEILRALLNLHLVVVDSPALDSLTTLAINRVDHAARTHGVDRAELAARLGVKWPADPVTLEPLRRVDTQQRQADGEHVGGQLRQHEA